jgi:hypothetical protein
VECQNVGIYKILAAQPNKMKNKEVANASCHAAVKGPDMKMTQGFLHKGIP